MKRWTILCCAISSFSLGVGCATNVPDGDATPHDSDLDPDPHADARLISVGPRLLPDSRPFQLEGILGGDIQIAGRLQGDRWYLAFAPGAVSSAQGAQLISSSQTSSLIGGELAQTWSSALLGAATAGASPPADDLYTVLLTAESSSTNGETEVVSTVSVQVRLDNTPPIARITRLCLDAAGEDCFGFAANPADVGASNSPGEIFTVPRGTETLYVFGIAQDKNFTGYHLKMVGGQAADELFLCGATPETNAGCVGEQQARASEGFGYGVARDDYNQSTLSSTSLVDAYSADVLLSIWNVSYLTPDAYGLHLVVTSGAYWNGDDDPNASSTWVTFLLEGADNP